MRTLIALSVLAVSLACATGDSPAPSPAPAPRAEPPSEGFGALFDRDAPAPRAPSGDTAEPAPLPTPDPVDGDALALAEPTPAPAPVATTVPDPAPAGTVPRTSSPSPAPSTDPAPPAADASWRAVVAFHSGPAPVEFTAMVDALRTAGAPHGIQVVMAPLGAESVRVDGGSVDIGAFRAARDAGFVFKSAGRQPVFAHYPPQTPVISSASGYFGVTL